MPLGPSYEDLCRRFFPPEEAEQRIQEHRLRIRENQVRYRKMQHSPRYTGVIPKKQYNEARKWIREKSKEYLQEDMERSKKGDFLSQIPTEIGMTANMSLEKWMRRERIPSFLCDMARQGILEPHPMGGWMAARPKIKDAEAKIVEVHELPTTEPEGNKE